PPPPVRPPGPAAALSPPPAFRRPGSVTRLKPAPVQPVLVDVPRFPLPAKSPGGMLLGEHRPEPLLAAGDFPGVFVHDHEVPRIPVLPCGVDHGRRDHPAMLPP